MDQSTEGAMVKVAFLRLYTADAGVKGQLCNLKAKEGGLAFDWSTDSATYEVVSKNPAEDCRDFDSVKSNWIKVDVSDWVREWRSDKESNIGIRSRSSLRAKPCDSRHLTSTTRMRIF